MELKTSSVLSSIHACSFEFEHFHFSSSSIFIAFFSILNYTNKVDTSSSVLVVVVFR